MKLSYSKYSLTPLRLLNAHSNMDIKIGMYLKIELDNMIYYSDYFPHESLGDLSVEDIIQSPKGNKYLENCIELPQVVDDVIDFKPFKNHKLDGEGEVVKLKLKSKGDLDKITECLEKCEKLRLDANGIFTIEEINNALIDIDRSKIEYIEDPSQDLHWDKLCIASAEDFIKNSKADFKIVKPNREIIKKSSRQIISSYMGSDLGRILCTKYLMKFGDLSLYHGVVTPNIYQEQNNNLFLEDNVLNLEVVKDIYLSLEKREWYDLKY